MQAYSSLRGLSKTSSSRVPDLAGGIKKQVIHFLTHYQAFPLITPPFPRVRQGAGGRDRRTQFSFLRSPSLIDRAEIVRNGLGQQVLLAEHADKMKVGLVVMLFGSKVFLIVPIRNDVESLISRLNTILE